MGYSQSRKIAGVYYDTLLKARGLCVWVDEDTLEAKISESMERSMGGAQV